MVRGIEGIRTRGVVKFKSADTQPKHSELRKDLRKKLPQQLNPLAYAAVHFIWWGEGGEKKELWGEGGGSEKFNESE